MRKVIRIFLASSIVEFAIERMAIENFIRKISDDFEENYDVKIQPLLCENFDDAYSKIRKQDEYNEAIRKSDLCFFIFFTKVGKYTKEEFEVARKKFEETGKPKIYTYFKVVKDEQVDQSLHDFMDELENTFEHFYCMFEHIDTLKLRILTCLTFQEMDFVKVNVKSGKCFIDGKPIIPLDNISEFTNNNRLRQLGLDLKNMEDYVNKIKNEVDVSTDSINKANDKIQLLKENILSLQEKIFKVSLNFGRDVAYGKMSERQKRAYRLFEKGDLNGALDQLSSDEIMSDFRDAEQMYLNAIEDAARKCIKEQRLAISLLQQNEEVSSAAVLKIVERYKLIVPIIKKYMIEIDALYDYMMFLDNNIFVEDKRELLQTANDLFKIYLANPTLRTLYSMYDTCNIIADNLKDGDPDRHYYIAKAEQSLYDFLEKTADKKSFSYAMDCMRVAELPIDEDKAISLYREAISVFEQMNDST